MPLPPLGQELASTGMRDAAAVVPGTGEDPDGQQYVVGIGPDLPGRVDVDLLPRTAT